jgi:anti-sigma factor RsiW
VTFVGRAQVEYPSGWTCEVTVVRLERYVVESLPRREMLAVGEHLEACVECAQSLALLRAGTRHG